MKSIILSTVLIPFLVAGYAAYQVNFYESEWREIPSGDCLMIMGARVLEDGSPDIMMAERVSSALDYISDKTNKIILTGGKADQEKSEAQVMKEILTKKGIGQEKFVMEEESTSTFENLVYSKPLILQNDCQKLDIISHDFHLARIRLTADRLDIPINRLIPVKTNSDNSPSRISREYKAYLWYWLGWGWIR